MTRWRRVSRSCECDHDVVAASRMWGSQSLTENRVPHRSRAWRYKATCCCCCFMPIVTGETWAGAWRQKRCEATSATPKRRLGCRPPSCVLQALGRQFSGRSLALVALRTSRRARRPLKVSGTRRGELPTGSTVAASKRVASKGLLLPSRWMPLKGVRGCW